jgi:hypothetical protein
VEAELGQKDRDSKHLCSMDINDDKWTPKGIRVVGSDDVAGTTAMDALKRYLTDKKFRIEVDPNDVDPLPQFEHWIRHRVCRWPWHVSFDSRYLELG